MRINPADTSYRTFCELIAAYRMFYVTQTALTSGIIDLIDKKEGITTNEIISLLGLKQEETERFLALLEYSGLLEAADHQWRLSPFSKTFLSTSSFYSQRDSLEFEPLLMEKWQQLGAILRKGQGSLVEDLPQDQYLERLQQFHRVMAEAARVRSNELWDAVSPLPERGTIIDLGAGDGTYLKIFLQRHPQWRGVLCDLPDVCERVTSASASENLTLFPCNLLHQKELDMLVEKYRGKAGIALLSNLYHCYALEENRFLLQQITRLVNKSGLLIVHDFFRDTNSFGTMYDLHMLANTLNGRVYSISETCSILVGTGFSHTEIIELPSFSLALVARQPNKVKRAKSIQLDGTI